MPSGGNANLHPPPREHNIMNHYPNYGRSSLINARLTLFLHSDPSLREKQIFKKEKITANHHFWLTARPLRRTYTSPGMGHGAL